jgi:hypothetical protein
MLILLLLAAAGAGFLACANDREILDRHEQALADEDE